MVRIGNAFRPVVVACLAVLIGALTACGGESEQQLTESAKTYLAKNDRSAATVQLKAALQKNPQSGEARYLLGKTLLELGDAAAARVELSRAMDLQHDENDVLPELARAMLKLGEAKKLVDLYAQSKLQDARATADFKTSLATAYLQRNARPQTDALLAEALSASPGFAPGLLLQARLKAGDRDFDGAAGLVEQVLKADEANPEAWLLKGQILWFGKSDKQAAASAFQRASEVKPDYLPAHTAIIGLRLQERDQEGFKLQLAAMRKALPNHPETRFFQAQLALIEKDYGKARELAQQLLRVAPDNIRVLQLSGAVDFQNGSLLQAEAQLNKALQIEPNLTVARRLLAQTHLRTGQSDKALVALAPLLDKQPDAETLALAAEARLLKGDARQAELLFTRAAKLNPTDTRIRTAIALTQLSKGDSEAAFVELESVAAADSGTYADMALISARLRRDDFAGALRAIDALEKKQKDQPFAANLRGRVQLARKDIAGARTSFERALALDPAYFPPVASLAALDLQEKKPDQARQRFENVLKADPKNVTALVALAELKARTGGTPKEVGDMLANAVQLNPTEPGVRLLLIGHHLNQKDTKAALDAAQAAGATFPERPDVLAAVAQVQFASGNSQQAISTYRKVAALEPLSPAAHMKLADVYLALKDRPAATVSFRKALEITPDLLPAQLGLITLALDERRFDDVLQICATVQRQRPTQAVGWSFEGDVQSARNDWPAAQAAYRTALQREASPQVAVKLHRSLLGGKSQPEAAQFAASWTKAHPRDTVFITHLGELALGRSEFAAAETHYRSVVALQPNNVLALNNVAYALQQQRKPGSLPFAQKANDLMPGNPALMDTLALALAGDKEFARAIEVQKKALELAPAYHNLRLNLAKIHLQAGDKAAARKELEPLTQLGDKFAGHAEVARLATQL